MVTDVNIPGLGIMARSDLGHPIFNPGGNYYVWASVTMTPAVTQAQKQAHPDNDNPTVADLKGWPLKVNFVNLGRRKLGLDELFTPDLLKKNDWDAVIDDFGNVVLTAKKDLGVLSISVDYKPETTQMSQTYYIQETRSKSVVKGTVQGGQSPATAVPTSRRTVRINIGSPAVTPNAPPALVVSPVENKDHSIIVPAMASAKKGGG